MICKTETMHSKTAEIQEHKIAGLIYLWLLLDQIRLSDACLTVDPFENNDLLPRSSRLVENLYGVSIMLIEHSLSLHNNDLSAFMIYDKYGPKVKYI